MTPPAGDAGQRPGHLRLTLLILEGYVYLALIVAVFVAALGFLVWGVLTRRPFIAIAALFVGIPVAATTARAIRALWFLFPEPKGIQVGPDFGGRLFQEVHGIAARVGAPRIHRVLVTGMNNASALQTPRAAVFWPTNTLLLGYPLLAMLSVDHVRAVIAHELAHITHAHGRFTSWVHRTRLSWVRLLDVLNRHQSVPAHVSLLFRFYVPRLHAQAAAVSRRQEFLADRLAAEVAGADVTAQTLVAIELGHDLLDDTFWARLYKDAEGDANPPNPYSRLGPELWAAVEDPTRALEGVLEADTAGDTHPALCERLAALQQPPRWPDPVQVTAADYFFGPQKPALAETLDRQWQDAHGETWRKRHDTIRNRRQRLAELAAILSPTPQQILERGLLMEDEGDEDAALDLYLSAYRQGHPPAAMAAGRVLLNRDDTSGVDLIDAAMNANPELVAEGCPAVIDFLQRRGRLVDAYRYERRLAVDRARASMARTVTPA